ncbi:MAG: HAD-IA family hydrolase [Treponema sp.]|nr:HAD-IA family hydrolase [Treponema sp.]
MKALIFDLFYTLINPRRSALMKENEYDILSLSMEEFEGRNIAGYGTFAASLMDPYEEIAEMLRDYNFDSALLRRAADARMNRIRRSLSDSEAGIDKKNISLLQEFRRNGIKTCLISNADGMDIRYWDESPLSRCFDTVIFSCHAGFLKPDPRIYRLALERLGLEAEDCLYCGDGGHGELNGARLAGMKTVLSTEYISDLWPKKIPHLTEDADYVIHDLTEIRKLVSC